MSRRRGKRILIWMGVLLGIAIVVLALAPLWFPWVLRPIAKHYGLFYKSYQRSGYAQFALREVTFTNRNVRARADRVELPVPTAWLLARSFRQSDEPFVVANWELAVLSRQTPASPRQPSVHAAAVQIQTAVTRVQQWIPSASLTNGLILVQGERVTVPQLGWRHTNVTAHLGLPKIGDAITLRATTSRSRPWRISLDTGQLQTSLDVEVGSSNVVVKGAAGVGTNMITLAAEFAPTGILPRTATIDAPALALGREMLRINSLQRISGSARARWSDPMFEIDVAGSLESGHPAQALQFVLRAHGTTNQVEVSRLEISSPGLTAKLSQPLTVPFSGEHPPVVLNVEADLSRQPWSNLTGMIQGQVTFAPATNRFPRTEFSLSGTKISAPGIATESITANGVITWPRVELHQARVKLADGAEAGLLGHADLAQKTVGHVELSTTGSTFAQWLGRNPPVHISSLRATAQGPFTNLHYVVEAAATTMANRWMNETAVELKAQGFGRVIREASLIAEANKSTASMKFSGTLGGATNHIRLEEIEFRGGPAEGFRLNAPATVTIEKDKAFFRLETSALALSGSDMSLAFHGDVVWPARGMVACEVRRLRLRDFSAFLSSNVHALNINAADIKARWENGPVHGFARLDGDYTLGEKFHATCEMAALESGVSLTNLLVWSEAAPVIYARGTLPLRVNPAARELIVTDPARELDITLGTERNEAFWERLGKVLGIKLMAPEIHGRISGRWDAPKGEVRATVAKIETLRTTAVPPLTDIRLLAQLDRRRIHIPDLEAKIEGQPLHFSGEVPLREKARLSQMPDWTNARARLSIESAALAPFARYYPRLLAPIGEVDAEITFAGGHLGGQLTITNATTQPLGNFGALRDISARLELDGRVVRLQQGRARLAGEPVVASGFFHVQSNSLRTLPPFHINVLATNVALIRQPETVIRSDLDIALINSATNPPAISGTVLLRDSLYLSDLESLVPGSVAQPERRPPYFSVEAPPLADWQLNVRVAGHEFLKLRTPFLRGTVSADFRLQGTLREPIAAGEARMNSGVVEFPFGTLSVKQARAWLTREQPFSPQLYMTAAAKRFGYDVTMEATGTANEPVLQFSSLPSLTSEKIFLMLTAGELPRDEITFSTEQKAQRFAVFVGSKLVRSLGFGGTSERLTIRSGEEISETGSQTYELEYKLTDSWGLVGQYDRFNAFNVMIKRRVFSR